MSSLLLALALQGAAPPEPVPSFEAQRAELLAAAQACGFSEFQETPDDDYGLNVIVIAASDASDDMLRCLAERELESGGFVTFAGQSGPDTIHHRYQHFQNEAYRPKLEMDAREWFAARPEYGEPPVFDPNTDDGEEFAPRLTEFCGAAKWMTFSYSNGTFVLTPVGGAVIDVANEQNMKAVSCVLRLAHLTGAPIGFIGNELDADSAK
ncbi:hypothetical protein [Parerythrobacter aestuarii]|uniref:hypothetical protein n=1 Tax=Parerythrobacter aestuarii TaxID=3020909 RepID=UPI0024DEE167|nr:hypothetical protein [Parerythrobacter aestuarii]